MSLSFQALSLILPPNALSLVGSQVLLNFSELTNDPINFDSSCVGLTVKLMQALSDLTTTVNAERASENPSKSPITYVSKDLIGTADAPEIEYSLRVAVDTSQFFNNLIDPAND
ncbi:hypothetical protein OGM63_05690 [Plectonema radiosum NIES-515]|uniref:Uncharacterized protein n=1 Tax=Plectonema radiosum NIES-515 TaxID=2986073 RepID=A0ABT3AV75_9CYAN|nr:hypothetical protein [Plectonema radiosum]MCV3213023.1 hypothetical protein [Plectonema radiosum NIES-515]